MSDVVKEFNDYRSKMNDKILSDNNKIVKGSYIKLLKKNSFKNSFIVSVLL